MNLYNIEILYNHEWWEITEYMSLTSSDVYNKIKIMCENEEECIRITYKGKVVTFLQTRCDQLEWLINQDLDRLCENRIMKYIERRK